MSRGSMARFARIGRAFIFILGFIALRLPLHAETFNVNSTADMLSPPAGTVTLRCCRGNDRQPDRLRWQHHNCYQNLYPGHAVRDQPTDGVDQRWFLEPHRCGDA